MFPTFWWCDSFIIRCFYFHLDTVESWFWLLHLRLVFGRMRRARLSRFFSPTQSRRDRVVVDQADPRSIRSIGERPLALSRPQLPRSLCGVALVPAEPLAPRGSSRRDRSPRAVRGLPKARQERLRVSVRVLARLGACDSGGVSAGLARLPVLATTGCQQNSREKSNK